MDVPASSALDAPLIAAKRLGLAAFFMALALYAGLSSPTPDHVGVYELLIVTLLVVSALCGCAVGLGLRQIWAGLWALMCTYTLGAGLALAAINAASVPDIVRDLTAFGAIALPLCLAPLFYGRIMWFLWGCVAAGFVMATRYVTSPEMIWQAIASGVGDAGFLYLANSPLVMLAALWLLIWGCFYERRLWLAPIYIVLSAVPIVAMLAMSQRATLALLILAWAVGLIICAVRTPKRALIILLASSAVLWLGWDVASAAAQSLMHKTVQLGTNARTQEWRAVWDVLAQTPVTAMLGTGFGSILPSPAVGDVWVRFVHGFILSTLWKSGWLGLTLSFMAFVSLYLTALRRAWQAGYMPVLACFMLASAAPIMVYGSYKSLCFGLILTGIALLAGWTSDRANATHNPA